MFCSTAVSQKLLVKKIIAFILHNYSKCRLNLNIKSTTQQITNYQITKSTDFYNRYIYLIVILLIISYYSLSFY